MSQPIEITKAPSIVIKLGGVEYALTRPKMHATEAMQDEIEDATAKGKGAVKVMRKYLTNCGLPEAVFNELEIEEMKQITEVLAGVKKK